MKSDKKIERCLYPAVLTYGEKKITVYFPDLDVEISDKDEKSAYLTARVVLGRKLFELECDKLPLPSPTQILSIHLDANQATTLIDVYMPAVRMAEDNRSTNRMITLPAWLNRAAMERDINFSHMLQKALKKEIFNDYTQEG